jgi:hypothetical protein
MSQIADALPRIELKASLYQSPEMHRALSTVYANIIKFLQRAMNWYSEGKIKHIVSSILRPYELRFKDLVDEIARCSRGVDQLAFMASQIELRDMHLEQKELRMTLLDLRQTIAENQTLNYRGFLESKRRICEIQFSQILSFTASTSLMSPEDSLRFCQFLSHRRRLRTTCELSPYWRSRKLQEWASSDTSSIILVKGSSLHRHETKDFATDIVSLIKSMNIPVVWILGALVDGNNCQRSPIDVLKQLVLQILQINISLLNAQSPALNAARFQTATTEEQWFDILASVLVGLKQLYIVVDAGILGQELSSGVKWPVAFLRLIENLSKVCPSTTVKVILASYGATPVVDTSLPDQLEVSTIRIDGHRHHMGLVRSKRQGKGYGMGPRRQWSTLLKPFIFRAGET